MIYEYAVDPDLVIDWVLNRDVGLAPQFGMDQRRLVSDIAANWDGEVYVALLRHFEWDNSDPEFIEAEQFMTALMEFLRQGPSRGAQRTEQPWMDQVLRSHWKEPFHAILSRQVVAGCDAVITPEITRDLRNPRWYLPTLHVTSKTAEALAAQLAPLLRLANQIVLVDPYFEPEDERHLSVLRALLTKATSSRAGGRTWPKVTITSGVDHRKVGRESRAESQAQQWLNKSKHRCELARLHLPAVVPDGIDITFRCVAPFADGDEVHNRYLLTDVGGACVPYGFGPTGERVFDDITPLFEGQYRTRWNQFGKGAGLNVIGNPVVIEGKLRQ